MVGLIDDAMQLSAPVRLVMQILFASALCIFGAPPTVDLLGLIVLSGTAALAFQTLWIIVCINFFNFMDGMDGLGGLQAFMFFLVSSFMIMTSSDVVIGRATLCLSASVAGFLLWNLRPSTIFMGDSGSYFCGFLIGFLPLIWGGHPIPGPAFRIESDRASTGIDFTLGVILFLPFLADAGFTVLRRLSERQNIFAAHRTHLYQLLRLSGWSTARILGLYAAMMLFCLLLALARQKSGITADRFAAGFIIGALALWLTYSYAVGRLAKVVADQRES